MDSPRISPSATRPGKLFHMLCARVCGAHVCVCVCVCVCVLWERERECAVFRIWDITAAVQCILLHCCPLHTSVMILPLLFRYPIILPLTRTFKLLIEHFSAASSCLWRMCRGKCERGLGMNGWAEFPWTSQIWKLDEERLNPALSISTPTMDTRDLLLQSWFCHLLLMLMDNVRKCLTILTNGPNPNQAEATVLVEHSVFEMFSFHQWERDTVFQSWIQRQPSAVIHELFNGA